MANRFDDIAGSASAPEYTVDDTDFNFTVLGDADGVFAWARTGYAGTLPGVGGQTINIAPVAWDVIDDNTTELESLSYTIAALSEAILINSHTLQDGQSFHITDQSRGNVDPANPITIKLGGTIHHRDAVTRLTSTDTSGDLVINTPFLTITVIRNGAEYEVIKNDGANAASGASAGIPEIDNAGATLGTTATLAVINDGVSSAIEVTTSGGTKVIR